MLSLVDKYGRRTFFSSKISVVLNQKRVKAQKAQVNNCFYLEGLLFLIIFPFKIIIEF